MTLLRVRLATFVLHISHVISMWLVPEFKGGSHD